MTKVNRTQYVILGLLSHSPLSGYDIRRVIEENFNYFWVESYSQIYPTLKKLTEKGLTTVTTETQEGKPDRKVYTITAKGLTELRSWLSQPPVPETRRIELLLKLTFGKQVDSTIMEAHVKKELVQLQEMQQGLKGIESVLLAIDSNELEPLYQLMNVRYGLTVTQALVEWANQSLELFKEIKQREKQQHDNKKENEL